jgi:hypothetical protein
MLTENRRPRWSSRSKLPATTAFKRRPNSNRVESAQVWPAANRKTGYIFFANTFNNLRSAAYRIRDCNMTANSGSRRVLLRAQAGFLAHLRLPDQTHEDATTPESTVLRATTHLLNRGPAYTVLPYAFREHPPRETVRRGYFEGASAATFKYASAAETDPCHQSGAPTSR